MRITLTEKKSREYEHLYGAVIAVLLFAVVTGVVREVLIVGAVWALWSFFMITVVKPKPAKDTE